MTEATLLAAASAAATDALAVDAPLAALGALQVGLPRVDQLPGLLVAVPILAAVLPLVFGLAREQVGWPVALGALAIEAVLALSLVGAVYGQAGRVVHVLGGAAFDRSAESEGFAVGIELVADALSGVVVLLVAVVALAVLAYSRRLGPRSNSFYSGYLLLTGGLMGVALTGDLFNLFVFLEITGLATYALVASDDSPASAVAALKYLLIGTAGASMYLIGVGYLFVRTGTLNMVDVSRSLAGEPEFLDPLYGDPLVLAGFAFVATGLLVKTAIFPLHTWQPDAYAEAPDAVTVLISALVSTASAYALARVTWNVFTPAFFEATPVAIEALLALAGVSVVAGSVLAVLQRRVKRTFAYSSVAQFGLIVLGIGVAVHPDAGPEATRYAVYGVVVHLFAHALIKGGLFATAGALAAGSGARTVSEYAGLAKRQPVPSAALAVLGFGIVGVPPTVGFLGKWYLAVGAVQSGLWPVVLVVFASTLLSLLYVARMLEKLYFDYRPGEAPEHAEPSAAVAADGGSRRPEPEGDPGGNGAPGSRAIPLGALALVVGVALAVFGLGFAGDALTEAAGPVADAVIDGAAEVSADE